MKLIVLAMATAMLLVGCGGGSDDKASTNPSSSASPTFSSSTPASSATATMTLRDLCPQVEAALPQDMIPTYDEASQFRNTLTTFFREGDLEAQNALQFLRDGTETMYLALKYDKVGEPMVKASQAWDEGISAFAKRCKAAGSSALQ